MATNTMIEAGMTAGSPPTLSPLTLANGLTVPYSYSNGRMSSSRAIRN